MNRRGQTLEIIPKNSVGLEIGVWKGEFSEALLNVVKPKKMFLVDPWKYIPMSKDGKKDYSDRWYGGSFAKNQDDMDNIYKQVMERFRDVEQILVVREFSSNLKKHINSNSLDWCYIDGNHSYEYVLEDLRISLELCKENSLIIGDDYDNSEEIRQAVKDFITNHAAIKRCTIIEGQFILNIQK